MSITLGETLRTLELPFVRLTETRHAAGLTLAAHEHSKANVNFVLRHGFAECIDGRDFYCRVGGVLIKPAGVRHWNRYGAQPSHSLLIEFPPEFERSARVLAEVRYSEDPRFSALAPQLYREMRAPDKSTPLAVQELVLELVTEFSPRDDAVTPARLRRVRDMLEADGNLDVDAAARAESVSPAHLMRSFRRHFRCSMGEYVRARRIREAQRLLADHDAPLARIALEAGFYDQSHFTRTFKRLTRMTPSAYRRLLSR